MKFNNPLFFTGLFIIVLSSAQAQVKHVVTVGGAYSLSPHAELSGHSDKALYYSDMRFGRVPPLLGTSLASGMNYLFGYEPRFIHWLGAKSEVGFNKSAPYEVRQESEAGYFSWDISAKTWWLRNALVFNLWKNRNFNHRAPLKNLYMQTSLGFSLFTSDVRQEYKAEGEQPEIWEGHMIRHFDSDLGSGGFVGVELVFPCTERLEVSLGGQFDLTSNPPFDMTVDKLELSGRDILVLEEKEDFPINYDRSGILIEDYKMYDRYSFQLRLKYHLN